jgi:hypothetical protein
MRREQVGEMKSRGEREREGPCPRAVVEHLGHLVDDFSHQRLLGRWAQGEGESRSGERERESRRRGGWGGRGGSGELGEREREREREREGERESEWSRGGCTRERR